LGLGLGLGLGFGLGLGLADLIDLEGMARAREHAVAQEGALAAQAALLVRPEHAVGRERVVLDDAHGVLDLNDHVRVVVQRPLQQPQLPRVRDISPHRLGGSAEEGILRSALVLRSGHLAAGRAARVEQDLRLAKGPA